MDKYGSILLIFKKAEISRYVKNILQFVKMYKITQNKVKISKIMFTKHYLCSLCVIQLLIYTKKGCLLI